MTDQQHPDLVTVRVCLSSGLRVRMLPGDRCRAHTGALRMCQTALREVPYRQAERLWMTTEER